MAGRGAEEELTRGHPLPEPAGRGGNGPGGSNEPPQARPEAAQPDARPVVVAKPAWRLDRNVSWYGPGFYGQQTGCGGTLQYGQMGVAQTRGLEALALVHSLHGVPDSVFPIMARAETLLREIQETAREASERGADPSTDECRFRQRRVANALLAELFQKAFGDGKTAAVLADVLAKAEDVLVAIHLLEQRFANGLEVGNLGHQALP